MADAHSLFNWPVETMRLRVLASRQEFLMVHVAVDVQRLRESIVASIGGIAPDVIGCCVEVFSESEPGCVGVIYLPKDRLDVGLVSHELGHAAFRACERLGVVVRHWERRDSDHESATAPSTEETYCDILENLHAEFWREAYRLKLA